jgi:hypothetical protein
MASLSFLELVLTPTIHTHTSQEVELDVITTHQPGSKHKHQLRESQGSMGHLIPSGNVHNKTWELWQPVNTGKKDISYFLESVIDSHYSLSYHLMQKWAVSKPNQKKANRSLTHLVQWRHLPFSKFRDQIVLTILNGTFSY